MHDPQSVEPTKVLMLAPGASPHSRRPLHWLLDNGCRVLFMQNPDENPCPEGCEGYRFVRYPALRGSRFVARLGHSVTDFLEYWVTIKPLRRLWEDLKPDVVHVHCVNARAYHCAAAGLKPLVLTVWGSDVNNHLVPGADPAARRKTAWALSKADLVIVDAPDMIEKCARLAGRPIRTLLLPLGIDVRTFRPGYEEEAAEWRRLLSVPAGARVLLSARLLTPLYRHEIILEAFYKALPRLRSPAVLVFNRFMANPSYEQTLRSRAETLGIASAVRWMDGVPHEKLPGVYAFVDVVLSHPLRDAFPVTFLEAAACERPVITCRLPAYEGTFAARFFHMVEPGNVLQLSEAILDTLDRAPGQQTTRLAEAREAVVQEHDEAITVRRLLESYRSLIQAERHRRQESGRANS